MQARRAAPRDAMADADVEALIHADDLEVDYRVALLDLADTEVEDISADVAIDGTVSWAGADELHRSCTLSIARELAWDRDRVRPSLLLASDTLALRAEFYLGVFIITRPTKTVSDAVFLDGTSGEANACKGWDKLRLLRSPMGRSWGTAWSESGQNTNVAAEVKRLLDAAGWTGRRAVDPALGAVLLTQPYVWPLDGQGTTWLRVLVDLLAAGGGAAPWVDEIGTLHCDAIRPVASRPVEWTLDADDEERTIVGRQRTRTQDLSTLPNSWRFFAQNWPRTPVEGDGIYTPAPNASTGPASIAARERVVFNDAPMLDAATQAALVAQGDERRANDMRALGVRTITTGPLPLLGHRDLFLLRDSALSAPVRAVGTSWTQRFNGTDCDLTVEEIA